MLRTIFIKCYVFYFYFYFALRSNVFSENVRKPTKTKKNKRPNIALLL